MNKVLLSGHITKDIELRRTQNGKSVASFSLATNRRFDRETSDFHNIVAWGNTAEFAAKNFTKGAAMTVVGELQNRSYTDANGNKRYTTEIIADEIYFPPYKRQGQVAEAAQISEQLAPSYGNESTDFEDADGEDDLPF